ncbi:15-hydroxyprostaglandin dehydrogenase [NAD(+)]-like [Euwallacea fornicatus]|uniref:15-hydroxyprostaglandin dehydrogenase [NAD(+)]-like n=1 Tax=Euwallacea fornicatus TaxID=995702 RepID=UPI00338D6079
MASFPVRNKVALITGGVEGIGLAIAKELLRNGARGVTLADLNSNLGKTAMQELESSFGANKAIFVETDVRDIDKFEAAFIRTIEVFEQIDILVNNAGNLDGNQRNNEIDINLKGTINGMLVGFEKYLQTNRSGNHAVIMNLCSTTGLKAKGSIPIYNSTKFAVHGLTIAWGTKAHFERSKVKVVALCPGVTFTNLLKKVSRRNLEASYEEHMSKYEASGPFQTLEQCAEGALQVIELAPNGTVWVVERGEKPYQFVLPDRFKFTEKKYITNQ